MNLHLFEAAGIELEYMIVSRSDLSVLPVADRLLRMAHNGPIIPGDAPAEATFGETGWSNELVLHVIELKTARPTANLSRSQKSFADSIVEANRLLTSLNARLLGTSAHPWMEPDRETRLWPHGSKEIYEAFDRIFGCRGHGWSNLQSMHINLPFANDEEFGRLHAAMRATLPLLSTLCASSPFIDELVTGFLDTRLEYYRTNQSRLPLISGDIIPEPAFTMEEYHEKILEPIYRQLAPFDEEATLQEEWVNSRGAIARFDRMAIEIRTMDIQECPAMDLATAEAVIRLVRALCEERFASLESLQSLKTESLAALFLKSNRSGGDTVVDDPGLLQVLGAKRPATIRAIWKNLLPVLFDSPLFSSSAPGDESTRERLEFILDQGSLSERLLDTLHRLEQPIAPGLTVPRPVLGNLYRRLAECLETNQPFVSHVASDSEKG